MELAEALRIVGALANGRDPLTGQALATNHVCQQPQVVRALCLVVQHLHPPEVPAVPAGAGLKNAGKPWTSTEEAELVRAFDAGEGLSQLAHKHGRTQQAIHGRLYRLGKMPPWPLAAQHRPKADAAPQAR